MEKGLAGLVLAYVAPLVRVLKLAILVTGLIPNEHIPLICDLLLWVQRYLLTTYIIKGACGVRVVSP